MWDVGATLARLGLAWLDPRYGDDRESLRAAGLTVNLADQAARRAHVTWPTISAWPELDDGWAVTAIAMQ